MRQYVAYGKLITSANRRRSDGTHLDGRHGVDDNILQLNILTLSS